MEKTTLNLDWIPIWFFQFFVFEKWEKGKERKYSSCKISLACQDV